MKNTSEFKPGDVCVITQDVLSENIGKQIVLADRHSVEYDGKKYLAFDSSVEIAVSDFGCPDDVMTGYDYDGYITEDCIELVELFYLQDARSCVGNDMTWWAKNDGYTTDINQAEVFTKNDAFAQHVTRNTDVPWSVKYISTRLRQVVDIQDVKSADDLIAASELAKQPVKPKPKPVRYHCGGCGVFMSAEAYHTEACGRCGTENRS